jgi:hypothetical protein
MNHLQWENDMPLRSLGIGICLLLAITLVSSNAMGSTPETPRRTLVEVWCGGDDGLTQRLRDSIENEFKLSSDFQLGEGKKPGTLIVTIPSNVSWRQESGRNRVLYTIDFTSTDGRHLGSSKGRCWDDDLANCAVHIVAQAKVAARKVQ